MMKESVKERLVNEFRVNKIYNVCYTYNINNNKYCFTLSYMFGCNTESFKLDILYIDYKRMYNTRFNILYKDKLFIKNIKLKDIESTLNKYKVIQIDHGNGKKFIINKKVKK